MELHLNDDQIAEFLSLSVVGQSSAAARSLSVKETELHLEVCDSCRERLEAQKLVAEQLDYLQPRTVFASSAECPADSVWIEIASGLNPDNAEMLIAHAATCDHCGPLLRSELKEEEEASITSLDSSGPAWQKRMATHLAGTPGFIQADRGLLTRERPKAHFRSWLPRFAMVFSLMSALIAGGWYLLHSKDRRSAEKVITDACMEKRTLEFRFKGIPYTSPPQVRDSSDSTFDPAAQPVLTRTILTISEKLKSSPEDVNWLQASGRANMLVGNKQAVTSAISTLAKAQRLEPNNRSIAIDLATAHALYGQLLDTKQTPDLKGLQTQEYTEAIQLLGPIVEHEKDEVAEFNYALILEKMSLYRDAEGQWSLFIDKHHDSDWKSEAEQKLKEIRRILNSESRHQTTPLDTVEEVADAFRNNDRQRLAEIDSRIEEYQQQATQWLPLLGTAVNNDSTHTRTAKEALNGLAQLLLDRHKDPWLHEMIEAGERARGMHQAFGFLADSLVRLESSDENHAKSKALLALTIFREAHVEAGETRAVLVLILADQYGHRNLSCESHARNLLKDGDSKKYPWILAEGELELAICSPVGGKDALPAANIGLNIASKHHYPVLALRALGAKSSLYSAIGDTREAWSAASESLDTYWKGTYPKLRGYNALVLMDEVNYPENNWYVEEAILNEALPMVDGDPRTMMVAVEQSRLGQTLIETGHLDEAESSFQKVRKLLTLSPPGRVHDTLDAEAELGFAKVDLLRNKDQEAVMILQKIRPLLAELPDDLLQLDFYQTSGRAKFRSNDLKDAESDLIAAIQIAEKDLQQIGSEKERLRWSRRTEQVYRMYVELKLRTDAKGALRVWEWYRGAALRSRQYEPYRRPGNPAALPITDEKLLDFPSSDSQAVLLSFLALPHGYAVWVWDESGVREKTIALEPSETSALITRFVAHCSDPGSDLSTLHTEGSEIYSQLLSSVEPWFSGRKHLFFELDGEMKALPISLLVDPRGRYLSDRFEISISPGVLYLNRSREWRGITPLSKALVIDDPVAPGWTPLPEAKREALDVAASFHQARLIGTESLSSTTMPHEIATADVFHFAGHAHATIESVGLASESFDLLDPEQLQAFVHGRTQLVVLSACATSRGTGGFFDDDDSMVRELLAVRVPEVIASRWMVDSAATASLMREFYSGLLNGSTPSQAMENAMRRIRAQPGFSHPYYWAGFSVFGRG